MQKPPEAMTEPFTNIVSTFESMSFLYGLAVVLLIAGFTNYKEYWMWASIHRREIAAKDRELAALKIHCEAAAKEAEEWKAITKMRLSDLEDESRRAKELAAAQYLRPKP